MGTDMHRLARDITDRILPPVTLQIGRQYLHPEDGLIQIDAGCYRDAKYNRVSNWWYWTVVGTGEKKSGFGDNWKAV